MRHIVQYLGTVFSSWVVLMSGIVAFVVEGISRAGYRVGHYWWWGVAVFCVFVATYLTWLPEKIKNEAFLAAYPENVMMGNQAANGIDSRFPRAVVILEMSIGNSCGEPTIAQDYRLTIESPLVTYGPIENVLIYANYYDAKVLGAPKEFKLQLHPQDMLDQITATPIATGDRPRGYLMFWLPPGSDVSSFPVGQTSFVITFVDVKNRQSTMGPWRPSVDQVGRFNLYPRLQIPFKIPNWTPTPLGK